MQGKKIVVLVIYNNDIYYNEMKKLNEEYLQCLNKHSEIMKNITILYITYKNLSDCEYIIDENILYINGCETYIPGILNKTISAFEIITNKLNIEYDFMLRTNASAVINFYELYDYVNKVEKSDTNYYYIGPFNNLSWFDYKNGIIDNKYHGTNYCGGAFILLNNLLVINIIYNKEKLVNNVIDDVSIGQYINSIKNVEMVCVKDKINLMIDQTKEQGQRLLAYVNNRNKHNRSIDVNNFKNQIHDIINYNNKYSIVLPINPNNNIDQCIMNIKLIDKYIYIPDVHIIYIITSNELINSIKTQISDINICNKIEFINEESIQSKIPEKNWYYQQILKLKISQYIKTKYYLVLDIDMYLIKTLKMSDMFYENKIIYTNEVFPFNNPPGYTNKSWWENSCKLLDYNVEKLFHHHDLMGVTPQLLVTDIVCNLIELLKNKFGVHDWENELVNCGFTEFSLYWIYVIQTSQKDIYTIYGDPLLDVDEENSVLHPQNNEVIIKVIQNLLNNKKYHFLLIQGWLKIDLNIYSHLLPL